MFYQTKKTLLTLSYHDLKDESAKLVLDTFVRYESNHENHPFSIKDTEDVSCSVINVSTLFGIPNITIITINQK